VPPIDVINVGISTTTMNLKIIFGALFVTGIVLLVTTASLVSVAESSDINKPVVGLTNLGSNSTILSSNDTNANQLLSIKEQVKADNIKYAAIDNAIDDYLSGKTKVLNIPNTTPYIEPANSKPFIPSINEPTIDISNLSINQYSGFTAQASPNTINYLMRYPHSDANWSNTYIFFGYDGNSANNISAIDGRVNCLNNMEDAANGPGTYDEYVMHYWGKESNENDVENCIQMIRTGSIVTFNYLVNSTVYASITRPSGDTFSMYIKPYQPSGQYFNSVIFYVLDATTMQFNTTVIPSPKTQHMYRADMALEKHYDTTTSPIGSTDSWRWVSSFHVYNSTQFRMDQTKTGFVYTLDYPSLSNLRIANAYYTDFNYYIDTSNADSTLYSTRYDPNTQSYPSHP
jgi:hypothetical protein